MTPFFETDLGKLFCGDCLEVMREFPENSISAILTDPPYGLEFMGKEWDKIGDIGKSHAGFSKGAPAVKGVRGEIKALPQYNAQGNVRCRNCGKWKWGHKKGDSGGGGLGCECEKPDFPNTKAMQGQTMQEWHYRWATEALRVCKPGAHLLAFGGTRTFHRLMVAIEDAGWEIRDTLGWIYGSGFPKSLDVSKQLDAQEKKYWFNVGKAIDNTAQSDILLAWKKYSRIANNAGVSFVKNEIETGTSTPKNDSVHANVRLQANPGNNDAIALIAELSSTEALHICEGSCSSVHGHAGNCIMELNGHATIAERQSVSHEVTLFMPDFSALQGAWGWQGGNTTDKTKGVEALKTWLGRTKLSDKEDTNALCAALTDDLKRIILSQSKTFRTFDTNRQTACVPAMTAIITESTAANLITFTVDTLRKKAIDKEAGAERETIAVVRKTPSAASENMNDGWRRPWADEHPKTMKITAPATPAAQQWSGYGTNLKPSYEPIVLARKPLTGTVAQNCQTWGCGALNVDGCRIPTNEIRTGSGKVCGNIGWGTGNPLGNRYENGRFPANLILSIPENEYELRDDVTPDQLRELAEWMDANP